MIIARIVAVAIGYVCGYLKQVIFMGKMKGVDTAQRKRQFRCDKHLKNIWLEGRTCDLPWRYFKNGSGSVSR